MRHLSFSVFFCFAALLFAKAPFTTLAVGVNHKANKEHLAPGVKERNHPHWPTTNHIPQEELDALTNCERFKRGLPPSPPSKFAHRSFGGVHRRVPVPGHIKPRPGSDGVGTVRFVFLSTSLLCFDLPSF